MNPLLIRRRGMMMAQSVAPHDGQLEWIETDGVAYIRTDIYMTPPPRSCHAKIKMGANQYCGLIGGRSYTSGSNVQAFSFLKYTTAKALLFCFFYNYGPSDGTPYITYSVDNDKPFEVKVALRTGRQEISVKQEDTGQWGNVVSKSQTTPLSGSYTLRIFSTYEGTGDNQNIAPAGTRMYFVDVFSDFTYTTKVGGFVPWRENGVVGMKNTVTNTFLTSADPNGVFTGGPNVI